MALTKAEVNERFYNSVAGRVLFSTEAQGYLHPYAVSKLLAARAREAGSTELKILELGANDGRFATSLLKLLTQLTTSGEVALERIDYFAVEYARPALEAFLAEQEATGDFPSAVRGATDGPLVGTLARFGVPQSTLYLVHSEAGAFVQGGSGRYDAVILNELLDDLPGRAFYSDAAGGRFEIAAHAEEEGGTWKVVVSAEPARADGLDEMPPGTLAARSDESVAVVRGAAELLKPGGMLIVHDYGFVERYAPVGQYVTARDAPDFVEVEFPPGSEQGFPRAFFRFFGNKDANVVQITTDVGFAELVDALAHRGRVITLPHGNALLRSRTPACDDMRKGDGIFLSEFALLAPGDDLQELLARLDAQQVELRRRFAGEFLNGNSSVFADLLFVKT